MSRKLKDWEKHIRSLDDKYVSVCNKEISTFDWTFIDKKHAINTVTTKGRLVPCSDCMKVIEEETNG